MRRNQLFLSLLIVASLLLVALIFTDWLPLLRGPAPETPEWYWPYQIRPFSHWLIPTLATLVMGSITAYWLRENHQRIDLLLLIGGSILLQLGLMAADNPDIRAERINRTLSNLASGYFEAAAEIGDLNATLRTYPQQMPQFVSEHARTHPPGLIAANWLTIRLFERLPGLAQQIAPNVWHARCTDLWLLNRPAAVAAALSAWSLIPLLAAALTVLPAHALARELLAPQAGRLAVALTATIPSLLLFAPKSVQLYAPLTLLLLWLFYRGLKRPSTPILFLAGVLLSLMTFLSLGNAALLLLLGIFGGFVWRQDGRLHPANWRFLIEQTAVFGLGAVSVWLIYWLGWDVPPWTVIQTGLSQHYELVTRLRRYDWWLVSNLVDLLIFAGLPTVVGFVAGITLAIRRTRAKQSNLIDGLALALLLLILALNFSGSARGEVGRLWLFFLPLLPLVAAPNLSRWNNGRTAVLLVCLQLLITLSLALAWQPVRAVIVVAERPSMPATTPETTLDITFVEPTDSPAPVHLTGASLEQTETQLHLTLFWQTDRPTQRPYTVFNQLLNNSGQIVAQKDNWPVNGQWPPTCWEAGETIVDAYQIDLPPDLPAGAYTLITGLYDAETNGRLRTQGGQDAVILDVVQVR